MERRVHPMTYDPRWTTDGPNILAEEALQRIRQTLSEGWICGVHLHYGGGRSGDSVAFSTYTAFHSHVADSRPGDLFILWSVSEIRRKGLLLVDRHYHDAVLICGSLLSQDDLNRVRSYLAEGEFHEILSVASSAGGEELEATVTDLEGSHWDQFLGAAQRAVVPGGALCVLPLTKIDRPEFYLLKAKRPNSDGQVPLGGAY